MFKYQLIVSHLLMVSVFRVSSNQVLTDFVSNVDFMATDRVVSTANGTIDKLISASSDEVAENVDNTTIKDPSDKKHLTNGNTIDLEQTESGDSTYSCRYPKPDYDLKSVKFKPDDLNKRSSLFGYLNENITVALYLSRICGNVHLGSIYGTYIRNNNFNKSFQDVNDNVETIYKKLGEYIWPYDIHNLTERNRFVRRKLLSIGYEEDLNNNSLVFVREFKRGFYLDPNLNGSRCPACFCSVYLTKSDLNTKYILCFTPWFGYRQSSILYADYMEADNINYNGLYSAVSAVFIFLTLLVYAVLAELRRNVYGKCIVLYLISMFLTRFGVSLILLWTEHLGAFCFPIGYSVQFFWLTCFTMETVLCCNILLAFRVLKYPKSGSRVRYGLQLWVNCLYGYGLPALMVIVTIALQFGPFLEDGNRWKPNMNSETCFFRKANDMTVLWTYFYAPYGIMVVMNFGLYFATAVLIYKYARTTKLFRNSVNKSTVKNSFRNMFRTHIAIFCVICTNSIIQFVNIFLTIIDPDKASDSKNTYWEIVYPMQNLTGVLLFIVLVCRKKVLKRILKKFYDHCLTDLDDKSTKSDSTSANDFSISEYCS